MLLDDCDLFSARRLLQRRPYRVFVRWKPSSQTIEEYRQTLRKLVQNLREQAESGESNVSQDALTRLEMSITDPASLEVCPGMITRTRPPFSATNVRPSGV